MNYFLNTVCYEKQKGVVSIIGLVSIGIVSEEGAPLYLLSNTFNLSDAFSEPESKAMLEKIVGDSLHAPKMINETTIKAFFREQGVPKHRMNYLIDEYFKDDASPTIYYFSNRSFDFANFCLIYGTTKELPTKFDDFRSLEQSLMEDGKSYRSIASAISSNAFHNALTLQRYFNYSNRLTVRVDEVESIEMKPDGGFEVSMKGETKNEL